MKTYTTPTCDVYQVKTSMLMASAKVTSKRDGFDPSGGVMGNESIWDDTEDGQ